MNDTAVLHRTYAEAPGPTSDPSVDPTEPGTDPDIDPNTHTHTPPDVPEPPDQGGAPL